MTALKKENKPIINNENSVEYLIECKLIILLTKFFDVYWYLMLFLQSSFLKIWYQKLVLSYPHLTEKGQKLLMSKFSNFVGAHNMINTWKGLYDNDLVGSLVTKLDGFFKSLTSSKPDKILTSKNDVLYLLGSLHIRRILSISKMHLKIDIKSQNGRISIPMYFFVIMSDPLNSTTAKGFCLDPQKVSCLKLKKKW